ncbi:MAG: hypothetical protein JST86_20105 [Bacteroidetes bacterium]|nr:hypothetical protein [Bacteroidota bacterium]
MFKFLTSPVIISIICWCVICSYYVVSGLFIRAAKRNKAKGFLKKNGYGDYFTSALWILGAIILIASLYSLAGTGILTLGYLIQYYFFFIFFFGFIYGLLQWHSPGVLKDIDSSPWKAEAQYIIMSIQTQTSLGYTRAKPDSLLTEAICCLQVLVGFFFYIIFIARAVNALT